MSSMFRNLGSAFTFGAVETTRAKEARERYIERYGRHEERCERYAEFAGWGLSRNWRSYGEELKEAVKSSLR